MDRGINELRGEAIKGRNTEFARAQSAINSARFRALAIEIASWIEADNWMHADDIRKNLPDRPTIVETAAAQLNHRWKKLAILNLNFGWVIRRHGS
jgi:hypothetical protein